MESAIDNFIRFRDKTYEAVISGNKTRESYCEFWDLFAKKYPEFVKKEFGYKLRGIGGTSTLGQFALRLLAVGRESRIKNFLQKYGEKYFPECNLNNLKQAEIEKNDGTQTGKLVLNSEMKNNGDIDWLVDEKYYIDYKSNDYGMNTCTFKLADIKKNAQKNSGILVEYFDKSTENFVGLTYHSAEDVVKIYGDYLSGKLKSFKFKPYDNKESIQFSAYSIDDATVNKNGHYKYNIKNYCSEFVK